MKKKTALKLITVSLLTTATILTALTGCSKASGKKIAAPKGWHLVWNDEFNGNEIDTSKWDFQLGTGSQYGLDGWGNNELQYYRKENASVKDGNLILEARKESYEGMAYTSARLRTVKDDGTELFTKTYGRIEARIKMPTGNGICQLSGSCLQQMITVYGLHLVKLIFWKQRAACQTVFMELYTLVRPGRETNTAEACTSFQTAKLLQTITFTLLNGSLEFYAG